MSIRPDPKTPGVWIIDVGHGANRSRIRQRCTKEQAQEIEQSIRRKRGTAPRAADPRVREVALEYLETWKLDHVQGTGQITHKERVNMIVSYFGAYNLSSLTPELIEQYKRGRMQQVKPATINKELSVLSGLCKWARDRGMIEDLPRIKRFPPKLTTPPPPAIPAHSDLLKIIEAAPKETRGMYRLMLLYGLRSAEVRHLKAADVNLDRELIFVTGKGNKTRAVPIVDPVTRDILADRLTKAVDGYLWWSKRSNGPYKSLRDGLKRAAKRVGIEGRMYCHLLRHAAATELVGVADVRTVGALLGHTSSAVTDRYLHIRQDRLSDALRKSIQDMSQKE